ncbi:MAG: hypothetical protein HRT57_17660, partial [Crocinitomicaceae bacterium]|nr:hypothetical protein [Crocinitomicaceae bacterium]
SGNVVDNGDGSYTISGGTSSGGMGMGDSGGKLEHALVLNDGIVAAGIHTSCSVPLVPGVTTFGNFTIESYVDSEGHACSDDGTPSTPTPPTASCECMGGVVELVVEHNAGANQNISTNSGNVVDNGDGTYTISGGTSSGGMGMGDSGDRLLHALVLNDGSVVGDVDIHTSCSKPIDPGLIFGNFKIVSYLDSEGHFCDQDGTPPTPPTADCECMGGVVQLVVQYNGNSTQPITTNSGSITDNGDGTYTVLAAADDGGMGMGESGTLDKDLNLNDGLGGSYLHTSCSKPLDPGVEFGDFTIVSYIDKEGHSCPDDGTDPPTPPVSCECMGGVVQLVVEYNGVLGQTITTNSGEITDNGDGTYTIFGGEGDGGMGMGMGESGTLDKDLNLSDGSVDSYLHTSCSKPLDPGVVFGKFTIVSYIDKEGHACPTDPSIPNCDCEGGLFELVVKHINGSGQTISTNTGNIVDNGNGTYTVTNGGEKLGDKNWLRLNDGSGDAEIHTSCSQPVNPGVVFGNFTIVGYTDKEGNVCEGGDPTPPTDPCIANNAGLNESICSGSSVQLGVGNVASSSYTWSPSLGLSCSDCPSPIANPANTTTYIVTISNANCPVYIDEVTVSIDDAPKADAGIGRIVCVNSIVEIGTQSSVSPANNYVWSPVISGCDNCAEPTVTVTGTTTYSVTVSNDNCTNDAVSSVTIEVGTAPVINLTPQSESTICSGMSALIGVDASSDITGNTYAWSAEAPCSTCASQSVTPSTTTTYTVTVSNETCTNDAVVSMTVGVGGTQNITLTPQSESTLCSGMSALIGVDASSDFDGNTYAWS